MRTLFIFILSFSTSIVMAQSSNDSLYRAVVKNDTNLSKQFIKKGANVNYVKQQGWMKVSPLITAVNNKSFSLVKILIDNNADVNWKDGFQTTALMYAASNGLEDIVRLLLEKGADAMIKDNQGNDALSAAKESKNIKVVELITQAQKKLK
ncbi:ankyrin repeat domain-containing protein [Pedobacter sp. AW1-32]|uniref:ankyrin repeat domain-containing protein n=1 Tax=Pedobacter sp. AW1-32 TaxID=3383026 RepID=UPI003FF14C28